LCSEEDKNSLELHFKGIKEVKFLPAIKFNDDYDAIREAVSLAGYAEYIIFGSKHSVRLFMEELRKQGLKQDLISKAKVFAAGKATKKELEENKVQVYYAPRSEGISGIFEKLQSMEHGAVVEISSSTGTVETPSGFMYVRIKAYSAVRCLQKFNASDYDAIVFPSTAELDAFVESSDISIDEVKGIKAVCIGSKTYAKAKMVFSRTELCSENSIEQAIAQARGG
jgi:uroporphyrinogen-III synthase